MVSTSYPAGHSGAAAPTNTVSPAGPARLTRQQREDLIAAAKPWYDAGCAVHLAKPDGSKTPKSVRHGSLRVEPDVFPAKLRNGQPHPRAGQPNPAAGQFGWGWKRIASGDLPPMSWEQIASGIRRGDADGIGIICGAVSGGLEMVEVEGRARDLLPAIRAAAERLGHADLLARLESGCAEESPSGGLHYVLRVIDGAPLGNVELASRPDPAAEHGQRVLCETRGQGGWFVSAPSAGRTHGTGKSYRLVSGSPATIPAFTTAERDAIYDCFRAVDEMPARPARPVAAAGESTAARRERPDGEILPGDDFDQRASWADAIPPTWVRLCEGPTADEWSMYADGKRKTADHYHDKDRFYIYDTDCPGSKRLLSKFGLYAWLNHNGDFAAAARDLWRKGYGSRHDDRDGGDDEDGGTPVPVEPRPMPAGECRTLDDWRAETAARLADAVGRGGVISLDTGPTGAGKSHNTTAALRLASSSLTVLPTHSGVVERVQEMQAAGIDAVAYPELNADTCQQYDVASRAQSLGLAAGAAVCPGCPFNRIPNPRYPGRDADGEPEPKQIPGPCHAPSQYQGMMRAATAASHRVATHERLRRSSRAAEGVKVVVVDETPEQVLAPTLTVSVRQIVPVEGLAHGILNHWYSRATPEQKSFARAMNAVMAGIHATCAAVTAAGHREVDLNLPHDVPDRWQRLLFDHIRMSGGAADMDADALTLVTRAAAGELESLTVVTDMTPAGDLHHYVVGAWRPEIPADAAVIALDATGNADDLTAVADRPVVDCTPSGHLPLHHPVVQIPDDISMGTSAVVVAGMVEAFLASRPDVQRLGMMGHSRHIRELIDGGPLPAPARARIVKWCYFGEGPDRGSNSWHGVCDHILRLGTVRANPGEYRRWLIRHGLHAAAARDDGGWGRRDWEAVTVDGQPIVVQGAGYADPDWRRAYAAVSRAGGRQCDGRGRPIMPDGIPVTILSNEPGPYPIAPSLTTTPAAIRETVEVVRGLAAPSDRPLLGNCAKGPIRDPYRGFCANGPYRTAAVVQALMDRFDIDRRAAEVRLAQCYTAGALAKPKRGWWALPGSTAATASDLPQPAVVAPVAAPVDDRRDLRPSLPPTPAPAILPPPVQAVVISTHGPAGDAPAVDVVAACTPDTTTAVCTTTVQPAAAADDLMVLIDERAAIMEYDGGLDRETADRLAREMVLGRDSQPHPAPADDIVVTVDHASLHARQQPYVGQVLRRFPGTVRVIDDRDDPFASSRNRAAGRCRPGQCRCGHDDRWVQVPIHGGKSVRIDCGHCDRFGWFAVWHGKRMPPPGEDDVPDPTPTPIPGAALNCTVQSAVPMLAAAG